MFKTIAAALFAACAAAKDGSEFNGDAYIALSRHEKADKIWAKVTENTSSGKWHLAGVLFVGQNEVFDTPGDELACYWNGCRNKTIHAIGDVAKVEWADKGSHPYTGIFKGGDTGFVRLSIAAPADTKTPNIAPGMGVKFLRDGVDSANFVSMYSVDGQESFNFFENNWSNHVSDTHSVTLKPLEARFGTATKFVQTVGLSDMARWTQDGVEESPVFPWKLRFEPSGEAEFPSDTWDPEYTQYLQTISEGTNLFRVFAMDQPEELGGTEQYIADLVLRSAPTTTNWGDEHMYFRHQRMDDDLAYRPEWEPYTPKYTGIFENMSLDEQDAAIANCPFAGLLDLVM